MSKASRSAPTTINRTGVGDVQINNELADVITVTQLNPSFEGLSVSEAEYYLEVIDELSTALERVRDEDDRYDWRRENQTEYKVTVSGGAIGMAIALEGENVVFETINDGKRSRISLGLTPSQLQDRLDRSHALLNEIATLEVDESVNLRKDDAKDDALPPKKAGKSEPPTIKESGNILNESGIQDDDLLVNIPQSNGIRPNIRQSDASRKDLSFREDIEDKEEVSPEERKLVAKQNLDTLASLMAKQYDFELEVATDILKAIEGWEDRLAECSNTGNPTRLADVDESLRDFLVENVGTIQPLIDQALADKA